VKDQSQDGSAFINTLIGQGSSFRGDVTVHGFFRVDGDFQGSITTEGRILVSPSGRIKGRLTGRDIVVGGVVKGDLYATERITLLASALIVGNLYAPRIRMEQGVLVEGYCCATPRIREEGVHPHQTQKAFTLKIDPRALASLPAHHG
jgi:cytoskeletal protein CcmA (bactofilin family)